MSEFRKKPIVVEAELYHPGLEDGWSYEDKLPFPGIFTAGMFAASKLDGVRMYPYINTLEGKLYISSGDWIITGVNGERHPCKPGVVEAIYEPVAEVESSEHRALVAVEYEKENLAQWILEAEQGRATIKELQEENEMLRQETTSQGEWIARGDSYLEQRIRNILDGDMIDERRIDAIRDIVGS